jgi:hypothetical protein
MLDRSGFPSIVAPNRASSSAHAVPCGSFCRNVNMHQYAGTVARQAPITHNCRGLLLDRARAPFFDSI